MNHRERVATVADIAAGELQGQTMAEILGLSEDDMARMSDTETDRWGRAIEEVIDRLGVMGARP